MTPKALRTAEHFLLSRYFDYQQVSYHKTVVGFELILKRVLVPVVKSLNMEFSEAGIKAQIQDRKWEKFHDFSLIHDMGAFEREIENGATRENLRAVLNRRSLALLHSREFLGDRDSKPEFEAKFAEIKKLISKWARETKIDENLWFIWNQSGTALTKIGSRVSVEDLSEPGYATKTKQSAEQSIRILVDDGDSIPIVEEKRSLMSRLAGDALYSLRIYCLLPDGASRPEIKQRIMELDSLAFV